MGNTCLNDQAVKKQTQLPPPTSASYIADGRKSRDWKGYKDYDKTKSQINKIVQSKEKRLAEDYQKLEKAKEKRQAIIQEGRSNNNDVSFNLRKIDREIEAYEKKIARAENQIEDMNNL